VNTMRSGPCKSEGGSRRRSSGLIDAIVNSALERRGMGCLSRGRFHFAAGSQNAQIWVLIEISLLAIPDRRRGFYFGLPCNSWEVPQMVPIILCLNPEPFGLDEFQLMLCNGHRRTKGISRP
jgi:hypothetical protein